MSESDRSMGTLDALARSGLHTSRNLRTSLKRMCLLANRVSLSNDIEPASFPETLSLAAIDLQDTYRDIHKLTYHLQANFSSAPSKLLKRLIAEYGTDSESYLNIIAILTRYDEQSTQFAKAAQDLLTHGAAIKPTVINRPAVLQSTSPLIFTRETHRTTLNSTINQCIVDMTGKIPHLLIQQHQPEITENGYRPIIISIVGDPLPSNSKDQRVSTICSVLLLVGLLGAGSQAELTVDYINVHGSQESFIDSNERLQMHKRSRHIIFNKMSDILNSIAMSQSGSLFESTTMVANTTDSKALERFFEILEAYHAALQSTCFVCNNVKKDGVPPLVLRMKGGVPHLSDQGKFTFKHDTCYLNDLRH